MLDEQAGGDDGLHPQSQLGAQLHRISSTMEELICACKELSQPKPVQHMGVTMSKPGHRKRIVFVEFFFVTTYFYWNTDMDLG